MNEQASKSIPYGEQITAILLSGKASTIALKNGEVIHVSQVTSVDEDGIVHVAPTGFAPIREVPLAQIAEVHTD